MTAVIVVIVIFIADDAAAFVVIVAIIHHVKVNIFDVLNGVDRSNSNGSMLIVVDRGAAAGDNVAVAIHVIDIVNAVHFMVIAAVGAISAS